MKTGRLRASFETHSGDTGESVAPKKTGKPPGLPVGGQSLLFTPEDCALDRLDSDAQVIGVVDVQHQRHAGNRDRSIAGLLPLGP